jgi:hypothetical protein
MPAGVIVTPAPVWTQVLPFTVALLLALTRLLAGALAARRTLMVTWTDCPGASVVSARTTLLLPA